MNNFNFLRSIALFLLIQIIYYRKYTIKVQPNHTTVDEKIIINWGLHICLQKGIRKQIPVAYYIIPTLILLQAKKVDTISISGHHCISFFLLISNVQLNIYLKIKIRYRLSIFSNPQLNFMDNFQIFNKIFNCLKIIRKKSETEMKRIY